MANCKFYPEALCKDLKEFKDGEQNCPDPDCKEHSDNNFKQPDKEADE